jgi:hypothetical protein
VCEFRRKRSMKMRCQTQRLARPKKNMFLTDLLSNTNNNNKGHKSKPTMSKTKKNSHEKKTKKISKPNNP